MSISADNEAFGGGWTKSNTLPISIAIPTYRRDEVLIATIEQLLKLAPGPEEILVLDQTEKHGEAVELTLRQWQNAGVIKVIRVSKPSIPHAMNRGLCEAKYGLVLFVDDDIVPSTTLLEHYSRTLERTGAALVAGRVLQPWHEGQEWREREKFHFASLQEAWISEFMGGNFVIRREIGVRVGGFDEQFVSVAYNFEAEFAHRLLQAGHRIFYEPAACIHHLRVSEGGTRTYGNHLKNFKPNHAVGAYYSLLRTWSGTESLFRFFNRPVRAISTRHHLRRPWWIIATLVAEISGMAWAFVLAAQGPRLLNNYPKGGAPHD
jgi:GT2 family glycosyltransferase